MREFPKDGLGVEVGVWRGIFASLLLDVPRPTTLRLVDPWEFRSDYPLAPYGGAIAKSQADMDGVYQEVLRRFAKEIAEDRVQIYRGRSAQVLSSFDDDSLDWIYIDGDHTYEVVREDLALAARKIKPGGVVAGNEYQRRGWWQDGVTRAVDEFVTDTGAVLTRVGDTQYILGSV